LAAGVAHGQGAGPTADPNAPANAAVKSSDVETAAAPASGANSFTETQARDRIGKAGYTNVSKLVKDKQGVWQGTAMKDGKKVNVALDYKGNVTSQ
jgi:hypothetical protein